MASYRDSRQRHRSYGRRRYDSSDAINMPQLRQSYSTTPYKRQELSHGWLDDYYDTMKVNRHRTRSGGRATPNGEYVYRRSQSQPRRRVQSPVADYGGLPRSYMIRNTPTPTNYHDRPMELDVEYVNQSKSITNRPTGRRNAVGHNAPGYGSRRHRRHSSVTVTPMSDNLPMDVWTTDGWQQSEKRYRVPSRQYLQMTSNASIGRARTNTEQSRPATPSKSKTHIVTPTRTVLVPWTTSTALHKLAHSANLIPAVILVIVGVFFLWHHGELSDWQLGLAIVSLVTGLLIVFSWLYLVISWENTYTKARVYTGLRILHKILYMIGGAACIAGGIYVNVRLNRDDDTVASTDNLGANSRRILAWVAVGCGGAIILLCLIGVAIGIYALSTIRRGSKMFIME